jgi:hypothetical protein
MEKVLEYTYKARTEFSLGAKSFPVAHDKNFDIPLYGFVPGYEEVQSVTAESIEALHVHVDSLVREAIETLKSFNAGS